MTNLWKRHGKLYYLRYRVEGSDRQVIVATSRPETILGDTALCVNPDDERYAWLPQDARVVAVSYTHLLRPSSRPCPR